jgi:hypothetical protein
MYDYEKLRMAWKKTAADFEWDMITGPTVVFSGQVWEALDFKLWKWPGRGVPVDCSYQFIEGERITAEEYDALLDDPAEFAIRSYLPRVCGALEAFKGLPRLATMLSGYYLFAVPTIALGMPDISSAIMALQKIGHEAARWLSSTRTISQDLKEMGIPILFAPTTLTPFDCVSDFLRGMRGAMLDMYRVPDKLIEVCERLTPLMIEWAVYQANITGNPRVLLPLHRGSKVFMSDEQFQRFYWPGLRAVIMGIVDAGFTPLVLIEGDYTPRLEYLNELPNGKVIAWFDRTDIFRAKKIIGKHLCIKGNVPASLLCTGTASEVEEYCKKLIDAVGDGGGFIMGGAIGIPDEAKPENVRAMIDITKKYGVYR